MKFSLMQLISRQLKAMQPTKTMQPKLKSLAWIRWSYRWGLAWLAALLAIAPATAAVTGQQSLSSSQWGAIGLLGVATFSLSIYLFVAMFQPEQF